MNSSKPQTAQEYIEMFRQLAAITNVAMDFLEASKPIQAVSLDRIAQNVGTLAGLRGDSGIYAETRPEGLGKYQDEMYAAEYQLRDRLIQLGYVHPPARALSEYV